MEVHINPDLQAKVEKWTSETGRPANELIEAAVAGYFDELAQVRGMLDSRCDGIENGSVKPLDGEEFFETFRRREEDLLKKPAPR